MKIVIAIDSFKGSMSSVEAGQAAKEGVCRVYPAADVPVYPIADGGEGTVDALVTGLGGRFVSVWVKDPLGNEIEAAYGIVNDTTAVIEMSAAAGITLVKQDQLDPMHTTTYGVGQLIKDAIVKGCRHFVIGIGGSATNDGGIGMLQALGFEINDANGTPVSFGAKGLEEIAEIRDGNALPALKECIFRIACDVVNPLCGENGCSYIYGPQKGAAPQQILQMDAAMARYARITGQIRPMADPNAPGAGAAGGLGFAFLSYLNGVLMPGIDLILELIRLENSIQTADVVLTGEGKMDGQTAMGKAPVGIARLAQKYGKPVFAFAGAVSRDAIACHEAGIDAFFPILRKPCSLQDAMEKEAARQNMSDTVEQVMRVYSVSGENCQP